MSPAVRKKAAAFKWTPLRTAFCEQYIADQIPNATDAMRRAGCKGKSAKELAYKLMQHPKIRARIQELMDARSARLALTADRTMAEIGRVAHADIIDLYDTNGAMKPVRDIPQDLRRAIAAIEVDELFEWRGEGKERTQVLIGYTRKVKFWNKPDALQLEGRHLKLFTDKVEHDLTDGLADALAAARARAKNR